MRKLTRREIEEYAGDYLRRVAERRCVDAGRRGARENVSIEDGGRNHIDFRKVGSR